MINLPLGSFGFIIRFDGDEDNSSSYFQEVTGLSVNVNTTDYCEGGVNNTTHKVIGHTSYGNVILKRGLTDTNFLQWVLNFINGKLIRKNVIISVLGDDGDNSIAYKLTRTVPVKWSGTDLNVMQDTIAVESIELAVEGIEIL
jgi:phage tail-like protein